MALKIDEVGESQSELFLAKLVLLLAHKNVDAVEVQTLITEVAASMTDDYRKARRVVSSASIMARN